MQFVEIVKTTRAKIDEYYYEKLASGNKENSIYVDTVVSSRVKEDKAKDLVRMDERQQRMRCAYIIKNDWFKYGQGIAKYAYDETDDSCVYYQLSKFLNEPPTGRPTKFIKGRKTSEYSIFSFFYRQFGDQNEDGEEMTISSGVTTAMIVSTFMY